MQDPVTSLGEYLLFLICLELNLEDIVSLRDVCRILFEATRTKLLWIDILERAVLQEACILPSFLKTYDLLDAVALEAVARRGLQLQRKWRAMDLSPSRIWHMNIPQSITWLRLAAGRWLFVTSSDNHVSRISCWDLVLVFQGNKEPIANAYLPGQVNTAEMEIQDSGVVIALGLDTELPSVHVITLRKTSEAHVFSQLRCIPGSSHVLLLRGNFVGCALRNDMIVPHIIHWRENTIHHLPPPPRGFDVPETRCTPHLLVIWNDMIVVVRRDALELYTLPSTASGPIFLRSVKMPDIIEVVVVDRAALTSHSTTPLRFLVMTLDDIRLCTLELGLLDMAEDGDAVCADLKLADGSYEQWYHLCISDTGRRALWLGTGNPRHPNPRFTRPRLFSMAITPQPPVKPAISLNWNTAEDDMAVWGFPVIDFDDALGFTIIGNCFGELAIYDHAGFQPANCCRIAADFTDQKTPLPPLLSVQPIPLNMRLTPRPTFGMTEYDRSLTAHWSQDDLTLNRQKWKTGWFDDDYWDWDLWQGNRGDLAWILNHIYGLPGTLVPQAHAKDPDTYVESVIFRLNNRYFLYSTDQPLRKPLAQIQRSLRPTLIAEVDNYQGMLTADYHHRGGRNRWAEHERRGGRPHKNLVNPWTHLGVPMESAPLLGLSPDVNFPPT
ncbi:hypothetical protein B0H10DRAFT_2131537 [Mycena sp. CBHHK59/15]|nr:hypothetical protein B0H10DRAFT_2131537 [Mycena sp. CBHHK59/15]